MSAAVVVARARAMLGVPFRLHGCDPRHGIDCVGLALVAFGREGMTAPRYGLRSGMGAVGRWLAEAGLVRVDDQHAGDLLLVRPSPVQLHLMIATGGGFVHAHAGLGRVVEVPGLAQWPVIGRWRDLQATC